VRVKVGSPAADGARMHRSIVVAAGLAGLLLGGPGGAVFTAIVADAALRLAQAGGSRENQVNVAELVPAVAVLERGQVGALGQLAPRRGSE
jgi:hypothetical protein